MKIILIFNHKINNKIKRNHKINSNNKYKYHKMSNNNKWNQNRKTNNKKWNLNLKIMIFRLGLQRNFKKMRNQNFLYLLLKNKLIY